MESLGADERLVATVVRVVKTGLTGKGVGTSCSRIDTDNLDVFWGQVCVWAGFQGKRETHSTVIMRRVSFDPTDEKLARDIRTVQTGSAGTLHHNPIHAISFLKPKKVLAAKCLPAFLSVDLIGPGRG